MLVPIAHGSARFREDRVASRLRHWKVVPEDCIDGFTFAALPDQASEAFFLVDRNLHFRYRNGSAGAHFLRNHGLCVSLGQLKLTGPSVHARLLAASLVSSVELWREQIKTWVKEDVSGTVIHAALCRQRDYTGS